VGLRVSLDAVMKRKILCPCQGSNHGHPAQSLVTILTELSWILTESLVGKTVHIRLLQQQNWFL